jgi:phosphate transport system substrate-binding protein
MRSINYFKFSLVLLALGSNTAFAQVTGAGSTFVKDLVTAWAVAHGAVVGGVTYDSVGSGAGVTRAKDRLVDFGATDVPLTTAALNQASLRQWPLAASAVAIIVNLPELGNKPVRLSGSVLGEIYKGNVTKWNDSQIANLNPGLPLPDRAIVPVWRTDGSGQAYAVASYMARFNRNWRRSNTVDARWSATVGRGVGGNEMVPTVSNTPGAIGFAPLGAASGVKNVGIAEMRNIDQGFVSPNLQSISATLANADWSVGEKGNFAADLDTAPGAAAYPITMVTYALLPTVVPAGRRGAAAFLMQAIDKGDAQVQQTKFVPLPIKIKAVVAASASSASASSASASAASAR